MFIQEEMQSKDDLEREKVLLESSFHIFSIHDPKRCVEILERIRKIEEDIKNGKYKNFENRGR